MHDDCLVAVQWDPEEKQGTRKLTWIFALDSKPIALRLCAMLNAHYGVGGLSVDPGNSVVAFEVHDASSMPDEKRIPAKTEADFMAALASEDDISVFDLDVTDELRQIHGFVRSARSWFTTMLGEQAAAKTAARTREPVSTENEAKGLAQTWRDHEQTFARFETWLAECMGRHSGWNDESADPNIATRRLEGQLDRVGIDFHSLLTTSDCLPTSGPGWLALLAKPIELYVDYGCESGRGVEREYTRWDAYWLCTLNWLRQFAGSGIVFHHRILADIRCDDSWQPMPNETPEVSALLEKHREDMNFLEAVACASKLACRFVARVLDGTITQLYHCQSNGTRLLGQHNGGQCDRPIEDLIYAIPRGGPQLRDCLISVLRHLPMLIQKVSPRYRTVGEILAAEGEFRVAMKGPINLLGRLAKLLRFFPALLSATAQELPQGLDKHLIELRDQFAKHPCLAIIPAILHADVHREVCRRLELLHDAELLEKHGERRSPGNDGDDDLAGDRPSFDRETRELRYRGQILKKFKNPARNQVTVLVSFQELDWVTRIDDPLSAPADRRKTRNTLKDLNDSLQPGTIRFSCDGDEGIRWSPSPAAPPAQA